VNSDFPDRSQNADLFEATRASREEPFGMRTKLTAPVNGPSWDIASWISADRRFLVKSVLQSMNNRVVLYFRESVEDSFTEASDLGAPLNAIANSQPVISRDGERAYFHSRNFAGYGELDLWMVRRVRK
jgi:hypothetical protein